MSTSRLELSHLSNDIISKVFLQVPLVEQYRLRRANKRFKTLIEDVLWNRRRSLANTQELLNIPCHDFWFVLSKMRHLQRISLDFPHIAVHCLESVAPVLAKSCPFLRYFTSKATIPTKRLKFYESYINHVVELKCRESFRVGDLTCRIVSPGEPDFIVNPFMGIDLTIVNQPLQVQLCHSAITKLSIHHIFSCSINNPENKNLLIDRIPANVKELKIVVSAGDTEHVCYLLVNSIRVESLSISGFIEPSLLMAISQMHPLKQLMVHDYKQELTSISWGFIQSISAVIKKHAIRLRKLELRFAKVGLLDTFVGDIAKDLLAGIISGDIKLKLDSLRIEDRIVYNKNRLTFDLSGFLEAINPLITYCRRVNTVVIRDKDSRGLPMDAVNAIILWHSLHNKRRVIHYQLSGIGMIRERGNNYTICMEKFC